MLRSARWMSTRLWIKRGLFGGAFGAGVTIALAWYFAVASANLPGGGRAIGTVQDTAIGALVRVFDERRSAGCRLRLASGVTTDIVTSGRAAGGAPVVSRPSWLPHDFGPEDTLREEHVGWPLLAMRSGYGTRTPRGGASREARLPAMSFPTASTTYILPLTPIWSGFLVNTLLFGSVYVAAAAALQYARRSHVGRCSACRYSLGGLPAGAVCPECGTPQQTPLPPVPA